MRQLAVRSPAINANTVAKVYAELERAGVLATQRGIGTFVRDTPPSPPVDCASTTARATVNAESAAASSTGCSPMRSALGYLRFRPDRAICKSSSTSQSIVRSRRDAHARARNPNQVPRNRDLEARWIANCIERIMTSDGLICAHEHSLEASALISVRHGGNHGSAGCSAPQSGQWPLMTTLRPLLSTQ